MAYQTQSLSSRLGRPLRVLHIGNVANNAYKNVKLLNEAGLDCDVICYDYYHIIGAPEWEDAEIEGRIADQFYPNWSAVRLNGFSRPRWFAQGPVVLCLRYLLAKRRGQSLRSGFWWWALSIARWSISVFPKPGRHIVSSIIGMLSLNPIVIVEVLIRRVRRSLVCDLRVSCDSRHLGHRLVHHALAIVGMKPDFIRATTGVESAPAIQKVAEFDRHVQEVVEAFRQLFPDRADQLCAEELQTWRFVYPFWRELFQEYDAIQAYATDPILPLLTKKRPYIGYEHGTLRDIPFIPSLQGRITALGYALADGVFITNGDCLSSVPKLKIRHYAPMVHPVDEREYSVIGENAERLRDRFGVRYIFLCTLRHDWKIKGTDIYLRALPLFVKELKGDFKLILTTWGNQIDDSRKLIGQLEVKRFVHWIEPLPRRKLIRVQKSVDVLFDQVALPHFGATAPEGIAARVPVLMSYDPESTSWIVSEPAPILTVWTPEDVVRQTLVALDPDWRHAYKQRAQKWIVEQHSYKRVVEGHFEMYQRCLDQVQQENLQVDKRRSG